MSDLLKSNFGANLKSEDGKDDERQAFRARALESISGSMVFIDDKILMWDIELDE